mmetsp:Transcript_17495/g.28306  ORF Transcript_17495/g.28306 Transcript_17495/m.28306 type:complete len:381 (+) Transcript_17495:345-1487(+)|eukprot:CAMPEP_0203743996 /NCGR_PEP_ID=MMETSP0098-20131031/217_1 /ASSEMBLY_ACC=CAM_ASM_000208 /TAXON_ID=96639 /ORGANISM=" , Strain NY0313808BC1" /LENGTH=380 /DNA_ID=CAMNT_0050631399 /DNA_START=339 /DNA_END=1481 /DNA_ORIENTATION=-
MDVMKTHQPVAGGKAAAEATSRRNRKRKDKRKKRKSQGGKNSELVTICLDKHNEEEHGSLDKVCMNDGEQSSISTATSSPTSLSQENEGSEVAATFSKDIDSPSGSPASEPERLKSLLLTETSPKSSGEERPQVSFAEELVQEKVIENNYSKTERKKSKQEVQYFHDDDERTHVPCHEFHVGAKTLVAESIVIQDWLRVLSHHESGESTSRARWKNRWTVVHNNVLYFFSSYDAPRPSTIVILDQVTVEAECTEAEVRQIKSSLGVGKSSLFKLRSRAGRVLYLQADSVTLKNKWIDLLESRGYEYRMQLENKPKKIKASTTTPARSVKSKQTRETSAQPLALACGAFVFAQVLFQAWLEILYFLTQRDTRSSRSKSRRN